MNIKNNKIWIRLFTFMASFLMVAIVVKGQTIGKDSNSLDNSKAISSVASFTC